MGWIRDALTGLRCRLVVRWEYNGEVVIEHGLCNQPILALMSDLTLPSLCNLGQVDKTQALVSSFAEWGK